MRALVISNDVIPGFGVPVAAPGLRAQGLAAGLTSHGIETTIAVPADLLRGLFGGTVPPAPPGSVVVEPPELMSSIADHRVDVVVFINANLTPHLHPVLGVHFVYDLFAPKILEALASETPGRTWQEMAAEKERAFALADSVWVNGQRKLGYALGWLLRAETDRRRTVEFDKPSLVGRDLVDRLSLVEMPIVLPEGISHAPPPRSDGPMRVGVAGYAQQWSHLGAVHLAHSALIDSGIELHALLPTHWGAAPDATRTSALPAETIIHDGPLAFDAFSRWVQSMDAMVDVFPPSAERHFAMITRSAVALRLGVPLLHGIDSEITDVITDHDAGWLLDPTDERAWRAASAELADPTKLAAKRSGARDASTKRFAPAAALAEAVARLKRTLES